jgi:hypothetical protein
MPEFQIVKDEDRRWVIALYDGPETGANVPPPDFTVEREKGPLSHWRTFGATTNIQTQVPDEFDTEEEARDWFKKNEARIRSAAPPGTTGP